MNRELRRLTNFMSNRWPCDPSGLCKVDETPKGWYIQYVDRDPETIRRQEEQARKKKHDLDDEERSARFIAEQVRRGRDGKEEEVSDSCWLAGSAWGSAPWLVPRQKRLIVCCVAQECPVFTELKRDNEEEKGGWVKFFSLLAPC